MTIRLLLLCCLFHAPLSVASSVHCVVRDTVSKKKFSATAESSYFQDARQQALTTAVKSCLLQSEQGAHCKTVYDCKETTTQQQTPTYRMRCLSRNTRSNQYFNASAEAAERTAAKLTAKELALKRCLAESIGWTDHCEPYRCVREGKQNQLLSWAKRLLKSTW